MALLLEVNSDCGIFEGMCVLIFNSLFLFSHFTPRPIKSTSCLVFYAIWQLWFFCSKLIQIVVSVCINVCTDFRLYFFSSSSNLDSLNPLYAWSYERFPGHIPLSKLFIFKEAKEVKLTDYCELSTASSKWYEWFNTIMTNRWLINRKFTLWSSFKQQSNLTTLNASCQYLKVPSLY